MDIRLLLLGSALLAAATALQARPLSPADLPAGFLPTWQEEGLRGSPRRVLRRDAWDNSFAPLTAIDEYDEDGLLLSHLVSSGKGRQSGADSWRLRLDDKGLREIIYAPARFGSGFMGGSARALRTDTEGRITLMAGGRTNTPSAARGDGEGGERLTAIRYELNRQVHETFVRREKVALEAFEFAPNGRLRKRHCLEGDCLPGALQEFGPEGPLRRIAGSLETEWHYAGGQLAAVITRDTASGTLTDQRHFSGYRLDACGNWTYREQYDAPEGAPGRRRTLVAMRQIDYHAPCPAALARD